MQLETSTEITWLVYTLGLTGVFWLPYILQLIVQLGPVKAVWDPEGAHPHNADWALRAKRAHYNAIENLAVFAPLVILTVTLNLQSNVTVTACIVYFFARLSHYLIHVFALPVLRTIAFLTGFVCQAVLFINVLGNI